MKKIIGIIVISCQCIFGNSFDVLENNGEFFFKYSKHDLLTEINTFFKKNKDILNNNFALVGDKIYKEGIKYGKVFIDEKIYSICNTQDNTSKCLLYMNGKRSSYTVKNISEKKNILYLTYDETGKKIEFLSILELSN